MLHHNGWLLACRFLVDETRDAPYSKDVAIIRGDLVLLKGKTILFADFGEFALSIATVTI